MKRLISLLLAIALCVSCMMMIVSCDNTPVVDPDDQGQQGDQGNEGEQGNEGDVKVAYQDPSVYTTFNGGSITTTAASGGTGATVDTNAYNGTAGKDYTAEDTYTYNDFMGGTTGLNWNPHAWETNDDSYVLGYITMGFYDFALNEDLTGYAVVPEMAADMPVDVTAEYVGRFGVEEGDTAKAFRIALNPNAVWEDGTAINADSYIYSMKEQLNPLMLNRRADSYYAGDFEIVNAKNYLYSGKTTYNLITAAASTITDPIYLDMGFWGMVGALDAEGNAAPQYVLITDDTMYRDLAVEDESGAEAWVSAKYLYDTYLADGQVYASYQTSYLYTAQIAPETTWEDVGLVKVDEYTIDVIVAKPIEEASFYVPYNLSSTWLVHEELYESCKSYFDAAGNQVAADADNIASITTNYCTSVETSISYGPYDLTYFEADKQLTFERNNSWYGYSDGKHEGQFMTDRISCQVIAEHATALQAFLAGEVDAVGLDSTDMETYASSDRIVYTPESYTTKLTFNTDYDKLVALGNNSQILAVKEFRQAFALALDREAFASEFTASHKAGYGLLNYMYCYNPFTGELYRDSDAAKAAICDTYGVTYGEDGMFETLDEAYDAVTGFDMEQAKTLMQAAYDKAVAAKIYDGESEIKLDIRVYNTDEIYVKMFNYFDTQLKAACVGTSFEGKVSLTMTADADYYNTMYSGNTAIIFSTWGGAAMSPFTMLNQVYCDAYDGSGNQMELGYNTNKVYITLNVDGNEITASLYDWANWCGGLDVDGITDKLGAFANYSYATRCEVFAACEEVYLSSFVTTPMYYRNGASLQSRKYETGTNTYLQIIGTGGIRHITYNYTDAEWEAIRSTITY